MLNNNSEWPKNGSVAVRTLATSNFTAYTEIGFDFASKNNTGFCALFCASTASMSV